MQNNDKAKIAELEHQVTTLEHECDVLKRTAYELTKTIEKLFSAYTTEN